MKMSGNLSFLLFAVAVLLMAAGCREKEVPAVKDTLVVGMELAYPPFEMTDEQGVPKGISVDLANELEKSMGSGLKDCKMVVS